MKKVLLLSISAVLFTAVFFACQKDNNTSIETPQTVSSGESAGDRDPDGICTKTITINNAAGINLCGALYPNQPTVKCGNCGVVRGNSGFDAQVVTVELADNCFTVTNTTPNVKSLGFTVVGQTCSTSYTIQPGASRYFCIIRPAGSTCCQVIATPCL